MDNALLIGLQAQRVLQRRMDVAANNLANVATSGFKADAIVLADIHSNALAYDEPDDPVAEIVSQSQPTDVRFVRDMGLARDMSQGEIAATGNPLDVAIQGPGFFTVQGNDGGLAYTRDGAFTVSGDGRLVTGDGRAVLDSGGAPITLDPAQGAPSIGRDGAIRAGGNEVGRLGVVAFARPGALDKAGDNIWTTNGQSSRPFEGVVLQGALEGSNVRPVIELNRLIEISRAYQSAANMVNSTDDLRKRAIDQLGRA